MLAPGGDRIDPELPTCPAPPTPGSEAERRSDERAGEHGENESGHGFPRVREGARRTHKLDPIIAAGASPERGRASDDAVEEKGGAQPSIATSTRMGERTRTTSDGAIPTRKPRAPPFT